MSNSTFPCKAVLVAAPHSGSGKTIICRGLTAALSALGLKVQTFKTGPDYIDPAHLTAASKRPCHNLDIWLMGEAACKDLWQRQTSVPPDALEWGAPDLALIEGVMGLYDGVGSTAEASSAHLARLLNVPVLLVVDVKGMGNSCSALQFLGVWKIKNFSQEKINTWNTQKMYSKAYIDKDGDLILEMDVFMRYGMTKKNLEEVFDLWQTSLKHFSLQLSQGTQPN